MIVKFKLNGLPVSFDVKPGEFLLDTLREHGVKSLKKGCDGSACGVCSLLFDGHPFYLVHFFHSVVKAMKLQQ